MTPAQSQTAAIKAWFNDWQHTILACVCLVCAVCAGVFVPLDRWEKLGRYLSDPATAVTFTAIGGVFVALYRRARGLPPVLALLMALGSASIGCGPSVTPETRTLYAIEQARCVENEEAIVARQGTTEAQDQADLAAERARCDAALRAVEGGH